MEEALKKIMRMIVNQDPNDNDKFLHLIYEVAEQALPTKTI